MFEILLPVQRRLFIMQHSFQLQSQTDWSDMQRIQKLIRLLSNETSADLTTLTAKSVEGVYGFMNHSLVLFLKARQLQKRFSLHVFIDLC